MARFWTSDLHFGHKNILSYCNRPYRNVEEMNKAIIKQWNSQVGPDDIVYMLGDFSIKKSKVLDKELVNSLNGIKYIVLGNHDAGFHKAFKYHYGNDWKKDYLEAGWKDVDVMMETKLSGGQYVVMVHLPPSGDYDNRYGKYKLINDENFIYLHGHLHCHYIKNKNMIDVGFDGFHKLYTEQEIVDLIQDERTFIPSHLTQEHMEMSLFLKPFEDEVKKKNLRKVIKGPLVLYNYTDHCTFEKNWNEVTRYSRGLIMEAETGKIVAAPFPKFWNLSELLNIEELDEKKK